MQSEHTAREQLFLEYVNRARLDPVGEIARLQAAAALLPEGNSVRVSLETLDDLNRGISGAPITGEALQPLAPNGLLRNAAEDHSQWMLDTNTFSHAGEDGSSVPQRINDAGYVVTPPGGTGENLSWRGTTGSIDMDASILNHHMGLFGSDGHRANILADWFKEAGIAQLRGEFTHENGVTYDSSMLTHKFAASGGTVFLTGVAYTDLDGDSFYSLGEGVGGVIIAAQDAQVLTQSAGGYALPITPGGAVSVTLTWGEHALAAITDASAGNVKLDLVQGFGEAGDGGALRLLTSANTELGAGVTEGQLLGTAHLSLIGNDAGNLLVGNSGDNLLIGGAGDDVFEGGAGDDTIMGGGGVNTARFSGDRADYLITDAGETIIVADQRDGPNDGTDTLHAVRFLAFADQTLDLMPPPITPETVSLTGTITLRGNGADPTHTQVTFTPDAGEAQVAQVDAEGLFAFSLAAGTSGTLRVVRDFDPGGGADRALTAIDALEVLKMVVGLAPPQARALDTLVADFDGDGAVTALDALEILKHVVALPAATAPEWVFAPTDTLPSGSINGLNGLPGAGHFAGIQVAALDADMHIDVTGILRGDMGYYDLV